MAQFEIRTPPEPIDLPAIRADWSLLTTSERNLWTMVGEERRAMLMGLRDWVEWLTHDNEGLRELCASKDEQLKGHARVMDWLQGRLNKGRA